MEINNHDDFLKGIIKNTEERYISYKKMLEDLFKNKAIFDPNESSVSWYKDFLRESKNYEESLLGKLRDEQQNHRQGLNPPFTYRY